jgi:hypothetical protein
MQLETIVLTGFVDVSGAAAWLQAGMALQLIQMIISYYSNSSFDVRLSFD